MMNIILGMSLAGSAVLLVWWLANAVRGNRLPARWHYRVLKASLFFMLVPVGWVSTLVGQWLDARAPAPVLPETVPYVPNLPPVEVLPSPGAITAPLPEATAPAAVLSIDLFRLLTVLWAVGAAVMLVYKLLMYCRFRRQVFRQNREVSAPETLQMFDACKQRLGIREPVDVRENPLLRTSLATGLLRPMIVLPAIPLSAEELRYLFLHELTHIKSRDLWVRFCSLLALCIHWYNPLMHLLNRKIQEVSEQNCDERVVSPLSRLERCAYGHVILKLASDMAVGSGSWAAPLSTKQTLERRLIRVLHTEKLKGRRRFLSVILAVVILACGTTAALAAQKNLPEPESDPSVQKDIDENSRLRQMLNQREAADTAVWFAPEDIHDIQSAELVWWDGTILSPADPAAPVYLESLLGGASQTTSTDCPFHSVLYLQRADGVLGKVLLAEDSCAVFQSNGVCYRFDAADNREFYALFGPETAGLPQWNTAAAMEQLKNSITYQGGRFSFTIPAGTANWDIHIAGRLDAGGGMSVHYLDGETWTPGNTYSFQADGVYTELSMDIALNGQETAVDLTDYIKAPTDGASTVLYPDAVRGDTALILSRGGTLLPDDDPSSYTTSNGVHYKLFATKNSTSGKRYIMEEYLVGNMEVLRADAARSDPGHAEELVNQWLSTLVNGDYPKNSKGESYGSSRFAQFVGYKPDLIATQGTRGESGYTRNSDRRDYGLETLDDIQAYMDWREANPGPLTIPLYDSEGRVIGEYQYGGSEEIDTAGKTIEEVKNAVAADLPSADVVRGDTKLILARGGTLLPDDDRESYAIIDGIPYKWYESKACAGEKHGFMLFEYKVGNKDILDDYQLTLLDTLVNGEFPKNSKGSTYGFDALTDYVGYAPDLHKATGTHGESGYTRNTDIYAIPQFTADECPHEFTVPLYDSEEHIIGAFPVSCGGHLNPAATGMSVEEAKAALDNGYQGSGPVKDTQELMDRLREENLVDGQYPTTADGKTYGVLGLVRDQHPDLVGVIASNGKSGYAKYEEFDPYGALLSDPDTTPEELAAAKALLNDCVRTMIPVYDLEGNIVGEYETYAFPS